MPSVPPGRPVRLWAVALLPALRHHREAGLLPLPALRRAVQDGRPMDTRRRQLEVGFELDPLNHSSAVFSFRKTLTSAPTVEAKLANTWEASNSPSVTTATLIATRANLAEPGRDDGDLPDGTR